MWAGKILPVLHILQVVTAPRLNRTDNRLEWNVEKECAEFGASVGRLEVRAWRDVDTLAARCYLHDASPRATHIILWTYGHDAESKKVLRICEFEPKDLNSTEIVCEYRMKMATGDNRRLLCWVKTLNEWNSEVRTGCISDEIYIPDTAASLRLASPSRMLAASETTPRAVGVEELRWGQKYLPPSDTEVDMDDFNAHLKWLPDQPSSPFGHYQVNMGKDVLAQCNLTDSDGVVHPVLWEFRGRPRLDIRPQALTWNSSISYDGRITGFFTIYLRKGKLSPTKKFARYGILLKKCNKTQESYRVPHHCSLTLPITHADIGAHAFFANFKYIASEEDKRNNKIQYCTLKKFIIYNITTDPAWAKRKKIMKEEIIFNKERKPGRGMRDSELPWSVEPMEGPGVRLNGVQHVAVGAGVILGALALSCCCAGISSILGLRRANMHALPCRCVVRKPVRKRKPVTAPPIVRTKRKPEQYM